MTVGELIALLKEFDPDTPVGGSDDMGDIEPIDAVWLHTKMSAGKVQAAYVALDICRGWREEEG